MHKVKDALTGHHDSENKASSQESSNVNKTMDEARDTQNSGGSAGINKNVRDSYEGAGNDPSRPMASEPYRDTRDTYGSSTAGPDTYGSTGGYGSSNLNTGARETQATGNMDRQFENRGTRDDTMDQTQKYTSDYGSMGDVKPGATHGYNTRSNNMGPNMPGQMETRAESEPNQATGQQGFGGAAAAGGSSYNEPSSGRRRSSGPHKLDLLNKLDPRVHSSDYEKKAENDQRGN